MWTFPTDARDSMSHFDNFGEKDFFLLQKYKNSQLKSMWATLQNVFETRLPAFRILLVGVKDVSMIAVQCEYLY
jgi:hypothetical protein